jgi:transcriptional regulator with XRE-family HTH domain
MRLDVKIDSKATARVQLGQIVRAAREAAGLTVLQLASSAGVPPGEVEGWEGGRATPSQEAWRRVRNRVRVLADFADYYTRARNEEIAETSRTGRLGTPLAPKLALLARPTPEPTAVTVPAPAPVVDQISTDQSATARPDVADRRGSDGRRLPPPRPDGSHDAEAVAEREAFVRDFMSRDNYLRLDARATGRDSIVEAVRRRFGIGVSPETIERIRAEFRDQIVRARVRAELVAEYDANKALASPTGEPAPAPTATSALPVEGARARVEVARAESVTVDERALIDAVEMILDAFPSLVVLSVRVGDDGAPIIDYQVRQVRTVGGVLRPERRR